MIFSCANCRALWVYDGRAFFDEQSVSATTGRAWGICPTCTGKYVAKLSLETPEIFKLLAHQFRCAVQKEFNKFRWNDPSAQSALAKGHIATWVLLRQKYSPYEISKRTRSSTAEKISRILDDVMKM